MGEYARYGRPHEPQEDQSARSRETQRDFHPELKPAAASGIEAGDTHKDLICTRGTIADIEQSWGYSMTSEELIEALPDKGTGSVDRSAGGH